MIKRFKMLASFKDPELRSIFLEERVYNLRPNNPTLARKVDEWIAAGKAEWFEEQDRAVVMGRGAVK